VQKIAIGLTFCLVLSACTGVGWLAGKKVLPLKKTPLQIETKIGDNSHAKHNLGEIAGRDLLEVKAANQVMITTIPWSVIWLLMVGWPLALIGWMIDPPCEIYRRYKLHKKRQEKFHVEHD